MYTKILSNLLTISSFRIGVPSILFLQKIPILFYGAKLMFWSFVAIFSLTIFWACTKQRFCFSESYLFSNQIGVLHMSIVPIMPRPKNKLHYIPYKDCSTSLHGRYSSNFLLYLLCNEVELETVKESRKNWNFHFDLQLDPIVLKFTFAYCQEAAVTSQKAQNFQFVE